MSNNNGPPLSKGNRDPRSPDDELRSMHFQDGYDSAAASQINRFTTAEKGKGKASESYTEANRSPPETNLYFYPNFPGRNLERSEPDTNFLDPRPYTPIRLDTVEPADHLAYYDASLLSSPGPGEFLDTLQELLDAQEKEKTPPDQSPSASASGSSLDRDRPAHVADQNDHIPQTFSLPDRIHFALQVYLKLPLVQIPGPIPWPEIQTHNYRTGWVSRLSDLRDHTINPAAQLYHELLVPGTAVWSSYLFAWISLGQEIDASYNQDLIQALRVAVKKVSKNRRNPIDILKRQKVAFATAWRIFMTSIHGKPVMCDIIDPGSSDPEQMSRIKAFQARLTGPQGRYLPWICTLCIRHGVRVVNFTDTHFLLDAPGFCDSHWYHYDTCKMCGVQEAHFENGKMPPVDSEHGKDVEGGWKIPWSSTGAPEMAVCGMCAGRNTTARVCYAQKFYSSQSEEYVGFGKCTTVGCPGQSNSIWAIL